VDQLLQEVSRVPGVTAAGLDVNLPLSGSEMRFAFTVDGRVPAPNERLVSQFHVIDGAYFRALGQPLLQGRVSDARDTPSSPAVVIVNEPTARRYFPDGRAIGGHLTFSSPKGSLSREIVGIVADVKHVDLAAKPTPELYVPQPQYPWQFTNLIL